MEDSFLKSKSPGLILVSLTVTIGSQSPCCDKLADNVLHSQQQNKPQLQIFLKFYFEGLGLFKIS